MYNNIKKKCIKYNKLQKIHTKNNNMAEKAGRPIRPESCLSLTKKQIKSNMI